MAVRMWGRTGARGGPAWALALAVSLGGGCYEGLEGGPGGQDAEGTSGGQETNATSAGETSGGDESGGESGNDDDGPSAACDENTPPRATLVRMNRTTYVNALTDLFGAQAVSQVQVAIDAMPATHGGVFSSETMAPSYSEVTASVDIAAELAYGLTADQASLEALDPCLSAVPAGADPGTDGCLGDLMERYGRRILRRPLTDEDRARMIADFEVGGAHSVGEGVATMLVALLIDPEFLYYSSVGGEDDGTGVLTLTPHETASKLARVLWNSIPDAELLDAADAGLDAEMMEVQVQRMLDDPRAVAAIEAFYYDWLEVERLPFPPEALFPDPEVQGALRDAMQDELLGFARRTTLEADGTYADLLLSRTAAVDSPELAQLYGVSVGEAVELPANERAGILTRAGFLATNEIRGSNAGHLIKRGDRLSHLICRPLPLPDPENFPQEDPADPESNPNQGIRERFNEATAEPICASCHAQLDGLGAPLGHYGAAGEWIDQETIELPDGSTNEIPIDDNAQVGFDDGLVEVSGALELSQQLAASRLGAECLAENLARNAAARELDDGDACTVAAAARVLAPESGEPGSIRQAIVDLVLSDHFKKAALP